MRALQRTLVNLTRTSDCRSAAHPSVTVLKVYKSIPPQGRLCRPARGRCWVLLYRALQLYGSAPGGVVAGQFGQQQCRQTYRLHITVTLSLRAGWPGRLTLAARAHCTITLVY